MYWQRAESMKTWTTMKEEYKLDHKLQVIQLSAYDPDFKPNTMDQFQFKRFKRNNDILLLNKQGISKT